MQRILILLLTVNFVFITTVHADETTPKVAEIKKEHPIMVFCTTTKQMPNYRHPERVQN